MGFITNQWLTRFPERSRGHYPVEVHMRSGSPADRWSKNHNVIASIRATRADGAEDQYQTIYFTTADLDGLLPSLAKGAHLLVRLSTALDVLHELDDAALLAFMKKLLSRRTKSKQARK